MILHTLVPYEEAIKGDVIGITRKYLKLGSFFISLEDKHNTTALRGILNNLENQNQIKLNACGLNISLRVHPAGSSSSKRIILWASLQLRSSCQYGQKDGHPYETLALGVYSRESFLDFLAYAGVTP